MKEYEMEIFSIKAHLKSLRRVIILKQKSDDIYVPIWIGSPEADAIALKLRNKQTPRPLSHDLTLNVISEVGGEIQKVVITNLEDETVYAVIEIQLGDRLLKIDARPSDAIALAVRASVPIYALEEILEMMGEKITETSSPKAEYEVLNSKDTSDDSVRDSSEAEFPVGVEELRNLRVFSDFIESLDIGLQSSPGDSDDPS